MNNKILIVEDDLDIRKAISIRLKANGYVVVVAGDGLTAIQAVQREKPGLVLLDIGIPGGNGLTVLERIKNLSDFSMVPVIVISARDPEANEFRAKKLGAVAFVAKPFENVEIMDLIKLHLPLGQESKEKSPDPKKILVIEDDDDARKGICLRLKGSGFNVVAAGDALSGVSMAVKEKPDLILLDLGLPGGGGMSVMERIQKLEVLSDIPIVILSARDPEVHRDVVLKAGARAYLQKPAENQDLLNTINQALN